MIINKTSITFHFLDNVLSNMFILQTLFTSITYKLQIHDLIILRRELNLIGLLKIKQSYLLPLFK